VLAPLTSQVGCQPRDVIFRTPRSHRREGCSNHRTTPDSGRGPVWSRGEVLYGQPQALPPLPAAVGRPFLCGPSDFGGRNSHWQQILAAVCGAIRVLCPFGQRTELSRRSRRSDGCHASYRGGVRLGDLENLNRATWHASAGTILKPAMPPLVPLGMYRLVFNAERRTDAGGDAARPAVLGPPTDRHTTRRPWIERHGPQPAGRGALVLGASAAAAWKWPTFDRCRVRAGTSRCTSRRKVRTRWVSSKSNDTEVVVASVLRAVGLRAVAAAGSQTQVTGTPPPPHNSLHRAHLRPHHGARPPQSTACPVILGGEFNTFGRSFSPPHRGGVPHRAEKKKKRPSQRARGFTTSLSRPEDEPHDRCPCADDRCRHSADLRKAPFPYQDDNLDGVRRTWWGGAHLVGNRTGPRPVEASAITSRLMVERRPVTTRSGHCSRRPSR
jgi:hypothetical protein